MAQALAAVGQFMMRRDRIEALVPFAVLFAVLMLVVPLSPVVIDIAIIFSMVIGILILLVTMYTREPLDFSIFPSIILFTTLFRLFLAVATTRSILSHAEAGHVIETFAQIVTANNPVVGLVIFIIIVVVNFVVITYGAQRIGEVAARFTLDALPGKQIAIDADLNAGIINEEQARERRRTLEREADYFGAMDGAGRFVQRDAMAGIILIIVNIGAGFVIGMLQMGMSAGEALSRFTQLTVGDGLVTSIPALLISTATGVMVTKAASNESVGLSIITQLTSQWRALGISSGFLFIISLVPGMPKLIIWPAALLLGWGAYVQRRAEQQRELDEEYAAANGLAPPAAPGAAAADGPAALSPEQQAKENLKQLLNVDLLELEIGYGLIPLVDASQGGDLLERVNNLRRQVAMGLGFIVPPLRIRDNIVLKPGEYVIKIKGSVAARGELILDRYLAMNPSGEEASFDGQRVKEPAFGLDALWIDPGLRSRAEAEGFTVVDPSTVLSTHLTEIIRGNAHELLSRQSVQELLDMLKERMPALMNELVPDKLSVGDVQRVLQHLLREKVSIRNLAVVLETLGDYCATSKDPEVLAEYVRLALGRQIIEEYLDAQGRLTVITLDPRIEDRVASSLQNTTTGIIPVLAPQYLGKLVENATKLVQHMVAQGYTPIFLVSPRIRPYLRKVLEKLFKGVVVLSYGEINSEVELKTFGIVENPEAK